MPTDHGLDPVIHAPVRLQVMVALAALDAGDSLTFSRLRTLLGLTAGNLITHARKLEDAGYVSSRTASSGKETATEYRLTEAGLDALRTYRRRLSEILEQVPG